MATRDPRSHLGSRFDAAGEMKPASSPQACTAGLVLAGGRSSRFGANKALAHFRGELLLDRALRPLQELAAIAISAREGSAIEAIARE
ncbi:MAG: NTP transferase domain-containing protein, partial [Proteobacteria bacterium]|nr:NTP transferase domain-containing protein [Pseudomonadota bacterium]